MRSDNKVKKENDKMTTKNGTTNNKVLLSLLIALILGAWGYCWTTDNITNQKIDRVDNKYYLFQNQTNNNYSQILERLAKMEAMMEVILKQMEKENHKRGDL